MLVQLMCLVQLASCVSSSPATPVEHLLPEKSTRIYIPNAVDPLPCIVNLQPCDPNEKYRRINASCNNLFNPTWGMTDTPFSRLLKSSYHDGIWEPRKAQDGTPLPNARHVRTTLFPNGDEESPQHSLLLMQIAHLITHDTAFSMEVRSKVNGRLECCTTDHQPLAENDIEEGCFPNLVPRNDTFYSQFKFFCMRSVRDENTYFRGCTTTAEQVNSANHLLDASFVYGTNQSEADSLRTFVGGTLIVEKRNNVDFLPVYKNLPLRKLICTPRYMPHVKDVCYRAGDVRCNIVPTLTALHIIFLRMHNSLAEQLSKINPHWNDEILYQEARRTLIACYQHIIYNEFLPELLGPEYVAQHNLIPSLDFSYLYDKDLNPSTLNSLTTSALRGLHSLIPGKIQLQDSHRNVQQEIRLRSLFDRPSVIQSSEQNLDMILIGLISQPAQRYDIHHTDQITNYLWGGYKFGDDLVAIDIQRNRDSGLPSYNDFRKLCKLAEFKSFDDYLSALPEDTVQKLRRLYNHPNDIDLTVGGLLEKPLPPSLVGPTFQCLLGEQFIRWKMGDRFFYEFGGFEHSFTKAQILEIKKITLARIIHGLYVPTAMK